MVSIHIVPVIVYLIIRVISCIFRFKCGADFVYLQRGSGMPNQNKRCYTPHLNSMRHAPSLMRRITTQEMSAVRLSIGCEIFQISL